MSDKLSHGAQKYQQIRKKDKSNIQKGFDLNELADEYSKLMPYRYGFVLENDEKVVFKFEKNRFHHMLGFHKIEDATANALITYEIISKSVFFEQVQKGNIGYDFIYLEKFLDANKINSFKKLFTEGYNEINFIDTRFKSYLGQILSNRFKCFSESTMLSTFGNRLVVDYEPTDYDSLIEADKVFYRLSEESSKNINFYVGKDEIDQYYPVTFFMESKLDSVKIKKDGTKQIHLEILVKIIFDIHTNNVVSMNINWANVRKRCKELDEFRSLKCLKEYFSNECVYSKEVIREIDCLNSILKSFDEKIGELKKQIIQYEKCDEYINAKVLSEREKNILFFMDFDIDIEDELIRRSILGNNISLIKRDLNKYENKQRSGKAKVKKYLHFLPLLKSLEIYEVKCLYKYFFNTDNWSNEFIIELIDKYDCYNDRITLDEIAEIVNEKPNF